MKYLTAKEAAAALDVSIRHIQRLVAEADGDSARFLLQLNASCDQPSRRPPPWLLTLPAALPWL